MCKRFTLLAGLLVCLVSARAEVRVWQSSLTLPTYQEGPPDENPPLELLGADGFQNYPYTMRKRFTLNKREMIWRTLEIENEFLKCVVLPDLGGRIYGCTDKIGKKEMFYANPVIKKADIGPRGAWAAAGTEFNFPIGHSWVNVSPVDFATAQNPDGSASIFVASTDRVYGMRWQVEIVLRPGEDVVEQRVTLSNPTALRHRFYWWNNAEITAQEDTRFFIPTYLTSEHAQANIESWPRDASGVDMSLLANHKDPAGIARFAYGSHEGFLGVYSARADSGTAHYADPNILPGKKIWSWGVGKSAADASKLLTDDGSIYVEIQAGMFPDQETYQFLNPYQSLHFTEYWMPLRGLGGIASLNPEAAVNLQRSASAPNDLKLALNVFHKIDSAKLRLVSNGKIVFEESSDLAPPATFTRTLPNVPAPCTFELSDAKGRTLLTYTEGRYNAVTPAEVQQKRGQPYTPKPEGQRPESDYLYLGNIDEQQAKRLGALDNYLIGLQHYPQSRPLHLSAGRLLIDLNRFEEAAAQLLQAGGDLESRYYLGLAYRWSGDDTKAKAEWESARSDRIFGGAASVQLARLTARAGDFAAALPLSSPDGPLEVALLRHLKEADRARDRLRQLLMLDPSNVMLRNEEVKLGGGDGKALERDLAADPARVLAAASAYMQAGLWSDAVDLLGAKYPDVPPNEKEPGSLAPQDNPLVIYYLAYAKSKLGLDARQDFARAARDSTLYVFPSGPQTRAVLEAAVQSNPSDATAHFLLGTLLMADGQREPAQEHWKKAAELGGHFPSLEANLGRAKPDLKAPEEVPKPAPKNPDEIARQALSMLVARRADDAAALFKEENFQKEKQSLAVREAFIELRLQRILTLANAHRCDEALDGIDAIGDEDKSLPFTLYGFGAIVKQNRVQYLLATAEAACGAEKAARKRWEKIARASGNISPLDLAYAQLASIKIGRAVSQSPDFSDRSQAEAALAKGILARAAGKSSEAQQSFAQARKLAGDDVFLEYLTQAEAREIQ